MKLKAPPLIEILAVFVILLILGVLFSPFFILFRGVVNRKPEDVILPPKTYSLHTVEHDNHLWILNRTMDYFVHHPDCSCYGKFEKE
jgi:hypothetical protein